MSPQLGGWLLAAGLGADSNFLLFAASAMAASALLAVIWRQPSTLDLPRRVVLVH